MIEYFRSTGGILIPLPCTRTNPAKPAAPCPPAIREKLRQLRAEFAAAARK